jgi:hypothetical protein
MDAWERHLQDKHAPKVQEKVGRKEEEVGEVEEGDEEEEDKDEVEEEKVVDEEEEKDKDEEEREIELEEEVEEVGEVEDVEKVEDVEEGVKEEENNPHQLGEFFFDFSGVDEVEEEEEDIIFYTKEDKDAEDNIFNKTVNTNRDESDLEELDTDAVVEKKEKGKEKVKEKEKGKEKGKEKVVVEESSDEEREASLARILRYICPMKLDTNCGAPYDGYSHRTKLNQHLRQHHPEEYLNMVHHECTSYTNRHASYVNSFLKRMGEMLKACDDLENPTYNLTNAERRFLLEWRNLTEVEGEGDATNKGMSKEEVEQLEKERYVLGLLCGDLCMS